MTGLLRIQGLPGPLLIGVALACLFLGAVALLRRPRGGLAYSGLMYAVAAWTVAYAFELNAADAGGLLFWAKLKYVGIVLAPVACLVFALQFAEISRRPSPFLLLLFLAVPVITLVILWRPSTEHLMWRVTRADVGGTVPHLAVQHGPWFWLHTAYSYTLYLVAVTLLLHAMSGSPRLGRGQRLPVLVAILAPLVGHLFHLAVQAPAALDPTPATFAVSGLALGWTLLRRRSPMLMPAAREAVFEGMRDPVLVLDRHGGIVDLNPAAEGVLGRAERLLGEHSSLVSARHSDLEGIVEGGEWQREVGLEVDGRERRYDLRSWPLPGDAPGQRALVFRDVTEQRLAEAARRASEQRLGLLTEQIPAALWTVDPDLRFTLVRGAGLRTLGLEPDELVGRSLRQILPVTGETHPAIVAHREALERRPAAFEMAWSGRQLECHVEPLIGADGRVEGIIGIGLDVTERRSLEDQLRHSQKMEAIGRMAGGVAHDFNNLLTAVAGYAQVAQEDLDLLHDPPDAVENLRRDLDAIEHAADRATSLTGQLLAFSRKQVLDPRRLDLDDLILEMEKMLRRLIGAHIELETVLDSAPEAIRADPGQVQQVILNLALNAREAMLEGGTVRVETGVVEFATPRPIRHDLVEPGRYVVLTVADTGVGMGDRVQAHLFEPFFTTKREGKGTGLGLSTAYGIIKQSDGYVDVESRPGEGATFRVYFPAAAAADGDRTGAPLSRLRGEETILLVEDEQIVRALAARVLAGYGYSVLEAEGGREALELCGRLDRPLDLLITDVVMPGMNGAELAVRVKALLPTVSVLFVSGYTGGALLEHGILQEEAEFLQKPFSPQGLARKVRQVLDTT